MLGITYSLYIHFKYQISGDQDLLTAADFLKQLYFAFFVWLPPNYSGIINILGSIPGILLLLLSLVLYKFSTLFGYILSYTLFSFIGLTGMFYLIYDLTSAYQHIIRYSSAIVASIMFSFPFFSHVNAISVPIATFLPWVFLFIKRLFYDSNGKDAHSKLNLVGLVLSASFLLSVGGDSFVVLNFIILIFMGVSTLLLTIKKNLGNNIKYAFLAFVLSVLINASWLTTSYIFTNHVAGGIFNGSRYTLNLYAMNLLQTLFSFGPWFISTNITVFIVLVVLGIFAISIFSYNYVKEKDKNRGIVASLLMLYVFMIGVAATISTPFGAMFSTASEVIPYLLTLRYPYSATHYVFLFIVSTLFGISIAYIIHRLSKIKKKVYLVAFLVLLSIIVVSYLYLFDYIPIVIGAETSNIPLYVSIPQHVFQISNYVNSQKGIFAVATIPIDPNWQVDSWYVSVNVYSSLINKPVYTGGYSYYNEVFFPNTEVEYADIAQSIENGNLINSSISNMLGVFGIHYIIIQGDALNLSKCVGYCLITPFKWVDIYNNFNAAHNVQFVRRYGNSSIYENNNYVPLVYATNIDSISNSSYSEIINYIENKSFNIQNNSIYSTSEFGLFNASGKLNVTRIENFSKPKIIFSQGTPTHITVHIFNATTPFYLVFRETYDPYWHAYYPNGASMLSIDHIAVNGFANAWYINRTGNYTVTLYYTMQTYAWIAWGVSFAALFVTIGIGVYGWKEMKKEKMRSLR